MKQKEFTRRIQQVAPNGYEIVYIRDSRGELQPATDIVCEVVRGDDGIKRQSLIIK